MKYKNSILILSILALFISFMMGVSYAYFSVQVVGNDTTSSNLVSTGTLKITFNGTNRINAENMEPGEDEVATFTVSNSGSATLNAYEIYFSNVINELVVKEEMVYEIECVASDESVCSGKVETEIPSTSSLILTQGPINPGVIHTYTLTVTFLEMGYNQDYNQEKDISFRITINELFDLAPVSQPTTLVVRTSSSSTELFWQYSNSISEVTFEDAIDIPGNAIASWDVSEDVDGTIMAYIIDDGLGMSTYDLFIQSDMDIYANADSGGFFANMVELNGINNLSLLNTSDVIEMDSIFEGCSNLSNLVFNTFNTSNVTSMAYMFTGCTSLSGLDLSSFDTSNVLNMQSMFSGCNNLTNLNVNSFDTTIVSNMSGMFYNCSGLISLNLSSLNTSSVTTMVAMFYNCSNLTNLDFRNGNFVAVSSHTFMFYGITSGITIIVKDAASRTFILSRLTDASITGTVTIYVP